ncbi:MAG: peptide deformylase [Desulfomonile tiedjei]|uniref:Peptide deformylase n=1 Tax=Desulfomonile tiedjei TaxID=2358 RepID=A0A9D6V0M8_9BACT|nr:peptide deformylase [Desulfomonile tiedjei]
MALRSIVVIPHEALNRKAKKINNIDDKIRLLAIDMAETMYKAPGVGLAANQVGELLRLIVVDVVYPYAEGKDKKKDPLVLINPEIVQSEGESVNEEGCLSVPDFGVEVTRAERCQVRCVDLEGNPLNIDAEGLLARALQHEIDHLNGLTILEHASFLKRDLYRRRLKKKTRRDR